MEGRIKCDPLPTVAASPYPRKPISPPQQSKYGGGGGGGGGDATGMGGRKRQTVKDEVRRGKSAVNERWRESE